MKSPVFMFQFGSSLSLSEGCFEVDDYDADPANFVIFDRTRNFFFLVKV